MHTAKDFFHPFHTFFPAFSPGHLLPWLASTAEWNCTLVSTFGYHEIAASNMPKAADSAGDLWQKGVAVNGSWEHFFYQLRMSQSAKICPCLSPSLYLVCSEGSVKLATPLGQLESVVASDSFLHPPGRAMCVVGLCPLCLCHDV